MIEIVDRETGELLDADSVPGLAEIAARHHERLDQLGELVSDLMEADSEVSGTRHRPVIWHELDPHTRRSTWAALAGWVGWLRGRYPLAHRVPPCWWRHAELVEELTALWLAWCEAYVEKGAPLGAGADWHGRSLPEFLRRIGAGGWNLACEGQHRPVVATLYDLRQVDDPAEFSDFIALPRSGSAHQEEVRKVQHDVMDKAVTEGQATMIGELPDAPAKYEGEYWTRTGDDWVPIDSDDTIAYLRDAERRMLLADDAVRRTEQS